MGEAPWASGAGAGSPLGSEKIMYRCRAVSRLCGGEIKKSSFLSFMFRILMLC